MFLIMPWHEIARRTPQVVFGLMLFGLGVAMMKAGNLGFGAWNVFHEGVARHTPLSFGAVIVVTGLCIVTLFAPLGEKIGPGTLLNALVIGTTVELVLRVVDEPSAMGWRVALMVAGPVVIGLGSGLYIGGGLGPGPRDGLMTGLHGRGFAIWKARTGLEVTALAVGLMLGGTIGIGTVWFTLGIGPLVQFFLPRFRRAPPVLEPPLMSSS